MAARSETGVSGRSPTEILGSNPTGGHRCLFVVSVVCCKGRGLCDGLITRPQESLPTVVCRCVIKKPHE